MLEERPHLLGGGGEGGGGGILGGEGPLQKRATSDLVSPAEASDLLASSIVQSFNSQGLPIPAERLPAGAPIPDAGWLVKGQFTSVDPGNRAQRAVIGFGAGEATAEVDVDVDRLTPSGPVPFVRFGTKSDSGHAPGAAVTMNPYVAAAKFVIGKNATRRDIQDMGDQIAKQIVKYAKEHLPPSKP